MRKITLSLVLMLVCAAQFAFAQKVITGTVTDAKDGVTLPGVSVVVQGTTVGILTGMNGDYSLTVPNNAQSLVFSFVGYEKQTVSIGTQKVINVALVASAVKLEEVVVTGYGIRRQARSLGSATANVTSQELTRASASNVVNGMTGKVSGLQIQTSNNGVNPATRITLRGNRHMLATNQALVVLDGVPVSAGYLNTLNPNDVESVNILKGASASALYGNDASNGVLIVTTKKGGTKPQISISNTTTFESVSYLPKLQTRFGSGSSEDTVSYDPNYTFWIGPDRNTKPYTSYENQSYGPEYNGQQVILGGILADGTYQTVPYSAVKNQKKNFFDVGVSTQNNISYAVGDGKSNYYISAQDVNTKGIIPDDKNRRTTVRLAGGQTYGIFRSEFTIGYSQTNTNTSGTEFYQSRPIYWAILNSPANIPLSQYKDVDNNKFAQTNGYFNAYYPNPYWVIKHSRNISRNDDVLGSLSLQLKPAKWIDLSYRAGITTETYQYNFFMDEANFNSYMITDPWGAGHIAADHPKYPGNSSDNMSNSLILTGDFLASFAQKFNDLNVKLTLGNAMYMNKYRYVGLSAASLVIPEFYNVSNRTGEPGASESKQQRNSMGVFADLTLGYKNFVFLHGSARNDWDSRLTKDNRSFFYPGVDASFVLSEVIPALRNQNSLITFAKVRAAWSKTGQVSLTNWYSTLPSFGVAAGFPYGGQAGFNLATTLSNPLLKPEQTKEIEAGLELGFYKDRIHLEVTAYKSNTKDQTIPASISAASGFYSAYINAGELESKGLETDLKMTPLLDFGAFRWDLSVNYSYNTSKILSLLPGFNELGIADVSYAIVGEQFPAIKTSDVYRDELGRVIVDPISGYPKKNPALDTVGHGNPNHMLGIVNTFSFKGFTFNFVADYRAGNVIYNNVGVDLDFTGTSWHSAQNGRQPFVFPNSVVASGYKADGSPIPGAVNTNVVMKDAGYGLWYTSDYHNVGKTYVTSAAYWKLREISLTYDLPVKQILHGVVKSLQVGLIGRNVLMLRPASNVWTDPEFNQQSGASNALGYTTVYQNPATRIFGFTVKATF